MLTFVVLDVAQCRLHEALELVGVYVAEALLVKDTEGLLHALVGRPLMGGLGQVLVNYLLELGPRDDGVLVVVCNAREGARTGRWTSQRPRCTHQQTCNGWQQTSAHWMNTHTHKYIHTLCSLKWRDRCEEVNNMHQALNSPLLSWTLLWHMCTQPPHKVFCTT